MTFLLIIAVTLAATQAPAPIERPAHEILEENRAAIQLWDDQRLRTIFKPYFDCYVVSIWADPAVDLKDDEATMRMVRTANQACGPLRQDNTIAADQYLAALHPEYSAAKRNDTLARYRRQVGLISVAKSYESKGKSQLLNSYFERYGREMRLKKTVAPLIVE